MKTIEKSGAQGDVLFIKVDQIPANAKMIAEGPRAVVAHSETGHHHVAVAERIRLHGATDPMIAYLAVEDPYADIVHERPFDTHETIRLPKGIWEVRRQREADPATAWRPVAD